MFAWGDVGVEMEGQQRAVTRFAEGESGPIPRPVILNDEAVDTGIDTKGGEMSCRSAAASGLSCGILVLRKASQGHRFGRRLQLVFEASQRGSQKGTFR